MKHLVLGGARSGKSRYAENYLLETKISKRAEASALIYVATAVAKDDEMATRIQHHQQARNKQWQLVEAPLQLATEVERYATSNHYLLIDCLTLWLSNALIDKCWRSERGLFMQALQKSEATIVMVGNQVGSGVVPMGKLSRQFVDESGWLYQSLAACCEQVTLVTAGLPQTLKSPVSADSGGGIVR